MHPICPQGQRFRTQAGGRQRILLSLRLLLPLQQMGRRITYPVSASLPRPLAFAKGLRPRHSDEFCEIEDSASTCTNVFCKVLTFWSFYDAITTTETLSAAETIYVFSQGWAGWEFLPRCISIERDSCRVCYAINNPLHSHLKSASKLTAIEFLLLWL